ncbi:MAG: PEP-CTERM sorting domain-containing protein [Verrucomicrobiaceae bacterium]
MKTTLIIIAAIATAAAANAQTFVIDWSTSTQTAPAELTWSNGTYTAILTGTNSNFVVANAANFGWYFSRTTQGSNVGYNIAITGGDPIATIEQSFWHIDQVGIESILNFSPIASPGTINPIHTFSGNVLSVNTSAPVTNQSSVITNGPNIAFDYNSTSTSTLHGISTTTFTTTPEPSSTALVGLSAIGLVVRRKR